MKFGEYLVAILIAMLTLPLYMIGFLIGMPAFFRYMRIKSM